MFENGACAVVSEERLFGVGANEPLNAQQESECITELTNMEENSTRNRENVKSLDLIGDASS